MMMNLNSSASSPSTSAAMPPLSNSKNAPSPSSSVPGLPDVPSTDAPLWSVQDDAAAAIRALRSAVDYDGRKKKKKKG